LERSDELRPVRTHEGNPLTFADTAQLERSRESTAQRVELGCGVFALFEC